MVSSTILKAHFWPEPSASYSIYLLLATTWWLDTFLWPCGITSYLHNHSSTLLICLFPVCLNCHAEDPNSHGRCWILTSVDITLIQLTALLSQLASQSHSW